MTKISIHVGNRIRQIRENRKISLLSFSYLCDIEYSHLSKIEFGKINTSIGHLVKISNALNVCIVCLFTNLEEDIDEILKLDQIDTKLLSQIQKLEK
jgi:transcriptional regulator with XRE-family HTH domain